jgi:hypothetical protein
VITVSKLAVESIEQATQQSHLGDAKAIADAMACA